MIKPCVNNAGLSCLYTSGELLGHCSAKIESISLNRLKYTLHLHWR